MKNSCLDLREYAAKIINYEKKEMIPVTISKNFVISVKEDLVLMITIKNIKRSFSLYWEI